MEKLRLECVKLACERLPPEAKQQDVIAYAEALIAFIVQPASKAV